MHRTPLLSHFDDATLARILGEALSTGGDFADVFFERREERSLALEDGRVRMASAGTVGGVGVRVLCGERTGSAYTEVADVASVLRAARTAGAIARGGGSASPVRVVRRPVSDLYRIGRGGDDVASAERVRLLEDADRACRAVDPRIRSVNVHLSEEVRTVAVVTSAGVLVEDVQPMVSLKVFAVAEENGLRTRGTGANSARQGLELLAEGTAARLGDEAGRQAVAKLSARPAPAGPMPVVLASGHSGILLHEAVGHGLEADFNRKNFSRYSGQVGREVASPLVTVVDDGTMLSRRGSLNVDDEGQPSGRTVLIENGILRGYMQDRLSADLLGAPTTGNGRRQSYAHVTNTVMAPGPHDPEEIVRSVDRGIYAVRFGGGQVEIGKGDFMFLAVEAYLIEGGRITAPLRDLTLIGNGPEVMSRVEMVGNDLQLSEGTWTCGKDGQSVPVGVGMPTVKISRVTVGGSAS